MSDSPAAIRYIRVAHSPALSFIRLMTLSLLHLWRCRTHSFSLGCRSIISSSSDGVAYSWKVDCLPAPVRAHRRSTAESIMRAHSRLAPGFRSLKIGEVLIVSDVVRLRPMSRVRMTLGLSLMPNQIGM